MLLEILTMGTGILFGVIFWELRSQGQKHKNKDELVIANWESFDRTEKVNITNYLQTKGCIVI